MLIKVTGTRPSGESFDLELEREHDVALGETLEYEGIRYTVEARSETIPDGAVTCRLVPARPTAEPAERCAATALSGGVVTRCFHQQGHLGPHQFAG